MISLIIGNRGSGKTKKLIELVNNAVENSNGNIVCIEKENKLKHDINIRARLIDTDHFAVSGFDAFFGFLCGICASDYDITDIYVDTTLRIGGRDFEQLSVFLGKVSELAKTTGVHFAFTLSADKAELPDEIFSFCKII
ncbi:MAG: hypothetical protein GX345_02850 [Clostridiales bacterium]|jgi:energy-coupling factor transporter ATP-binding protein EcfA2|nr:hypothetical protein [Clostridiales bacterium]